MMRNKQAASRNPPKKGGLPTKIRGAIAPGRHGGRAATAHLALFTLIEGSNKQTRKEIRPDESSRHDGRLGSKSQKHVPPCGYAILEGPTKPV
jgi:hypothetical protein